MNETKDEKLLPSGILNSVISSIFSKLYITVPGARSPNSFKQLILNKKADILSEISKYDTQQSGKIAKSEFRRALETILNEPISSDNFRSILKDVISIDFLNTFFKTFLYYRIAG